MRKMGGFRQGKKAAIGAAFFPLIFPPLRCDILDKTICYKLPSLEKLEKRIKKATTFHAGFNAFHAKTHTNVAALVLSFVSRFFSPQ